MVVPDQRLTTHFHRKKCSSEERSSNLEKQISSNTVFIRKLSPHKKMEPEASTFGRGYSQMINSGKLSPEPSSQFTKMDSAVLFNHTIHFASKMKEDLKEVFVNRRTIRRSEAKKKPSIDRMNMTARANYCIFRQRNRMSILNI